MVCLISVDAIVWGSKGLFRVSAGSTGKILQLLITREPVQQGRRKDEGV